MAKFIMRKMPDLQGNGKQNLYPKMLYTQTKTTGDMIAALNARCTLNSADIKAVLDGVSAYIAEQTALGNIVKVDGLGIFKASLAIIKGKEKEAVEGSRYNGNSVAIRSLLFHIDKQLVNSARQNCRLTRTQVPQVTLQVSDRSERLEEAREIIKQKGFLRIADYVEKTGLSRTTASLELRTFQEDGLLSTEGKSSHKVYVLPCPQKS